MRMRIMVVSWFRGSDTGAQQGHHQETKSDLEQGLHCLLRGCQSSMLVPMKANSAMRRISIIRRMLSPWLRFRGAVHTSCVGAVCECSIEQPVAADPTFLPFTQAYLFRQISHILWVLCSPCCSGVVHSCSLNTVVRSDVFPEPPQFLHFEVTMLPMEPMIPIIANGNNGPRRPTMLMIRTSVSRPFLPSPLPWHTVQSRSVT